METKKEYEVVNFTYYDPAHSLFKAGRSDNSFYRVYSCNNKENCDAYKRGKCILLNGLWGLPCPYGKMSQTNGPTKAAKSLSTFLYKAKETYGYASYKLSHIPFLCKIGDYIYMDLPHLKNYVNPIPEETQADGHLIKTELFTREFINRLVRFKPQALFGGEISSYQKEEVPKFINQLKRYFPEKFRELLEDYPEAESKIQTINYVDKAALVKTLLPGKVKLSTNVLEWDGNVIRAKGKAISFWNLADEDVVITPSDKTYVRVYDNATVTEDTVFKDA